MDYGSDLDGCDRRDMVRAALCVTWIATSVGLLFAAGNYCGGNALANAVLVVAFWLPGAAFAGWIGLFREPSSLAARLVVSVVSGVAMQAAFAVLVLFVHFEHCFVLF